MTQEDIKKRVLAEASLKTNMFLHMRFGDGGVEESLQIRLASDEIESLISQVLDTAFKEWSEAVRLEKKRHGDFDTIEYCEEDCSDCSWNLAVDELNKKLQELGE